MSETVEDLVEGAARIGAGPPSASSPPDLTTRIDVIVHFLALLELCKLGKVTLGQGRNFGDLEVAWVADDRQFVA